MRSTASPFHALPRRAPLAAGSAALVALLIALAAVDPAPALAAPARKNPPLGTMTEAGPVTLDAAMRAEILDSLEAQVGAHYVEADTAKMIDDAVRARAQAGAYDAITDPFQFSEAVTRDLRRVNGDLHLSLRYDPSGSSPFSAPVLVRRASAPAGVAGPDGSRIEVKDGPGGRRIVVHGAPGAAGAPAGDGANPRIVRIGAPGGSDAPPDSAAVAAEHASPFFRDALAKNFGLTKLEILPGNVGYLEVSGFMGVDGFEEALGDAMRFLARTDAILIDVRRNGGGNGEMSHLLFSHFLPATPVPTIRVKSREAAETVTRMSVADVPGPRRTDVPLYVLTSRGTGSAAEEFSFVLKNQHRATLVGDRTAGAGHMVAGFPLAHGFVASVSITRVSDPKTGAEWEGIGVQPDVKVAPEQALAVAHAMALRALAAKAEGEKKATLERTAEWVEAKSKGITVDSARLATIAGSYEGDRKVEIVDGKPMIRLRPGLMPEELTPMADGSYALLATSRLRFAPGNPSPSVTVERPDGSSSTYPRMMASTQ